MQSQTKIIYLFKKYIPTIFFLIMVLGSFWVFRNKDLKSEDSFALYGGRLESGYNSTGYLISYSADKKSAILCGVTRLSKNIFITASHCLEETSNIFLATSPLEPKISLASIPVEIYKPTEWDGIDTRQDFAIIKIGTEVKSNATLATIAQPTTTCNYTVVAHGRHESDPEILDIERKKKSGNFCITELDDDLIFLQSVESGICYADSGSSIFETNTENIVGIVIAILDPSTSPNKNESCFVKNRAIGIRVDSKLDFLSTVSSEVAKNFSDAPIVTKTSTLVPDEEDLKIPDQSQISFVPPSVNEKNEINYTVEVNQPPSNTIWGVNILWFRVLYLISLGIFSIILIRMYLKNKSNIANTLVDNVKGDSPIEFYEPPAVN